MSKYQYSMFEFAKWGCQLKEKDDNGMRLVLGF